MNAFYHWLMMNPLLASGIGMILTFVIGWALPNDKIKMAGFAVSQFIRKAFGEKMEEKIEQVVDSFEQGMKGDNK